MLELVEAGVIERKVRILAERTTYGIGNMSVKLWWLEDSGDVGIDLKDKGLNTSFLVKPQDALKAFYSPWGYLPKHIKPIRKVKDD